MKLNRLFALIAIFAVPFWGMAQTDIGNNEDENESQDEDESQNVYSDTANVDDEYVYVTVYEKEKKWVDRVITRLMRTSVDSSYITTNDFGLQVKLSLTGFDSYSSFRWEVKEDTMPNSFSISSEQITKIGFWLGYRNFGLGTSFELRPLIKDKSQRNREFSFSYYGDAWGADISLTKTRGNDLSFNGIYTDISDAEVTISRWQINSYYAPFYRKFSYNAAFSHSMRQEKSAGSPLVGLSINALKLHAKPTEMPDIVADEEIEFPSRIRYCSVNLNLGYAHNFVTRKKTLFHISALPDITLFKRTEVSLLQRRGDFKEPRIQWGAVGRFSWIWQKENHFISIYGSMNYNKIINSPLKVSDTIFRFGTSYGFRAYKHHQPRKQRKMLKRRKKEK